MERTLKYKPSLACIITVFKKINFKFSQLCQLEQSLFRHNAFGKLTDIGGKFEFIAICGTDVDELWAHCGSNGGMNELGLVYIV